MNSTQQVRGKILIVDDNAEIHSDFRKILAPDDSQATGYDEMEAALFGVEPAIKLERYHLDSAYQGTEALELVTKAEADGAPYALAFVDMRMPPGWDGMRTIVELHKASPSLQFVVCSAYSDYTEDQITQRLELRDGILFMRKPFHPADVKRLAEKFIPGPV